MRIFAPNLWIISTVIFMNFVLYTEKFDQKGDLVKLKFYCNIQESVLMFVPRDVFSFLYEKSSETEGP